MAFIRELSGHVPLVNQYLETSVPGLYAAGDVSGIEEASAAMVEGRLAGCGAAGSLGYEPDQAAHLCQAALKELEELRSGPAGAKIRAGLARVEELAQEQGVLVC